SGDSSKKFKIAEGQWYRYAPSYVSPAYHLLEGFPFIQEPPSGDLQERVLIRHHDYDQCFQSVQLLQWNSQVKFNVTVYRDRKSGSAGMPRPISYAVFCLKKKGSTQSNLLPSIPNRTHWQSIKQSQCVFLSRTRDMYFLGIGLLSERADKTLAAAFVLATPW